MEPDRKVVSPAESTHRELAEGTLWSWIAEPIICKIWWLGYFVARVKC